MPPKKRGELSSKERATIAKSTKSISLASNPFENIQQSRKKAIMGANNTQVRQTSKARSNDINVRKDTLLKDFWKQQKPSNKFVDKRQLAFDKTLNKVDKKRKKFQIGDDDEDEMDTNLKRTKLSSFSTLGDIDESIDKELFRDDYQTDDIDSRYSTKDEVSVLRNLKGIGRGEVSSTFGFEQQIERKLSKRERMNLRIRGFKERKMEQKMDKEDNLNMIELLDNDEDLMELLKSDSTKKETSNTNKQDTKKSLDYDKFLDMIKKGEDIDLTSISEKKEGQQLFEKQTKQEEGESLEETESSDEKETEDTSESYAQDSFIDDTIMSDENEEENEDIISEEKDENNAEEIEEDSASSQPEEEDIESEQENDQDGENSYIQDSFINDEPISGDEEEQFEEEEGLETTEKDLEELSQLISNNSDKIQEKLIETIEKNGQPENEKLFFTIVTLLVEQVGFGEWLSSKSKINFNLLVNDLTQVLFKLTTKQPNTAHDVFHMFLLSTFNKYEVLEVPNLGELIVLKMITTVYPLKERIESPILSLTNLLIHLYLEKSKQFLTSPLNMPAILFLTSLSIIIDKECTFYSPDVVNTLKEIIARSEKKQKSNKKKTEKKPNLFRSIYDSNEECQCFEWATHLLSIYSQHLEKNFSKKVSTNDHFKKLLDSEGFSSISRDHIENFNIIFEGIKLNEKPIQIDEVKSEINYKTKKPKAIAQFEPLLFGDKNGSIDSMKSKYTDENPEQTKIKTLKKKIAKEKRKAISELRKDNQFIRSAREQVAAEEAHQRKQKYKNVIDTLRSERMEQNQIDRKNRDIEKMKKDMRTTRKNVGKQSVSAVSKNK
ncbi:predicted protein [Naegleria gruberi]|uniref:Predicted protein n=1 Tax=Naegleria gruberi TaxID=5762 RepID=D2UZX1_NAEGR|nr:uncharacterized protein NAEGRDRAFT_45572 [Naegleria gruberi]EFC50008.1 predicted protein [Naegleria gruberi]|eukprot:XP_002682752.1 predicted protein [Naegleria gruberi strain NEG-M]